MTNKNLTKAFSIFIIFYLIVIVFPFIWVLVTSFKPESEIWGKSALKLISENPTLDHYRALAQNNVLRGIKNSFIVASLTTIYVTVISIFAGYALARLQFRGKNFVLTLVLAVSMFPQMIVVGPIYNMFNELGWTNSYNIIFPYSMISLPVAIYILVTHFKKIPFTLEESAKIDGATPMQTLLKIVTPLALPGIFTSAIITFIGVWNEYVLSLTLNTDLSFHTAPVAISFLRGQFEIFWGQVTAAAVVVTIPTLIIVLLFQRQIISGLTSGALKE
ncbi:MAG: sugar ABC transporter permease [Firmicutes bacterium HGW-Firmicutes-7]|nr:MAG: sugar ABC transporter permease [Firmicutes bacterium HGW-Firmicutes-7]